MVVSCSESGTRLTMKFLVIIAARSAAGAVACAAVSRIGTSAAATNNAIEAAARAIVRRPGLANTNPGRVRRRSAGMSTSVPKQLTIIAATIKMAIQTGE